ncbi:hypothetical protein EUGRSUZ_B03040 [Eucalyptus grandis]|uniref:Uncharacterized protein n=2 Tax=Eucalyptus grandis TaxID=71139 RepID=A0ACC3LV21_EUCGR|nr:hypothetical protein EUGRSUZ_B03040 [Eucalyptus grandis]
MSLSKLKLSSFSFHVAMKYYRINGSNPLLLAIQKAEADFPYIFSLGAKETKKFSRCNHVKKQLKTQVALHKNSSSQLYETT